MVNNFRCRATRGIRELAICSVRWGQWDDIEQALCIEAPVEFIAACIWSHLDYLTLIAKSCGFPGVLLILVGDRLYGPPIELLRNKAQTDTGN